MEISKIREYTLKMLVGCLISALFLWFVADNIKWDTTLNALKNLYPWTLLGIFFFVVVFFIIKAIRWSCILRPVSHKTARQLFPVMMAGVMINAALSVVVGEIIRSIMLGKQFRISKSSILATIVVERLFDVITLLALLILAVIFSPLEYPTVRLVVLFGLVFSAMTGLFLIVLWQSSSIKFLENILNWAPRRIREIGLKRIKLAVEGLGAFTRPQLLGNISFLSILQWLAIITANYLAILSVGIDAPFEAAVFVTVINAFALILPSSPGYIGVFEFGFIVGLKAFGIDASDGLAAAIIYHGIYLLTVALIGVPSWSLIEKQYE